MSALRKLFLPTSVLYPSAVEIDFLNFDLLLRRLNTGEGGDSADT